MPLLCQLDDAIWELDEHSREGNMHLLKLLSQFFHQKLKAIPPHLQT